MFGKISTIPIDDEEPLLVCRMCNWRYPMLPFNECSTCIEEKAQKAAEWARAVLASKGVTQ